MNGVKGSSIVGLPRYKSDGSNNCAYFTAYSRLFIGRHPNYNIEYYWKQRLELLDALGGKCVRCGFTDPRALNVDHVHGDGHLDIKKRGYRSSWPRMTLQDAVANPGKYQLLCANCNSIKRVENGEGVRREGV
jgi:hypothetical protein